jgi:hypothetical protein
VIDLELFKNIMAEARHNDDLLDSYSPNQFKSKELLIKMINDLGVINENSEIVIFGSWYGSILVPAFKKVKRITLVDIDNKALNISKNRLFNNYNNINYVAKDVFEWAPDASRIRDTDLIINTSCEHMKPMNELKLDTKAYFAYTSNNMLDIEGHINCVSDIEQFKKQLPDTSKVLAENKVTDERGTRFLLVGKI